MAQTVVASANQVQKWDAQFFLEYVRESAFMPYMGDSGGEGSMMPILTRHDGLGSGAKVVNIPFIEKLDGAGVRGSNTLTGNEEALGNYNMPLSVNWNRHAVAVNKVEEGWTEMDLRRAGKMGLKVWAAEGLRDDIITAMLAYSGDSWLRGNIVTDSNTASRTPLEYYTALSAGTKNAWLAANADRYLFGAAVSNNVANVHADCLSAIDTSADRLTPDMISLAKQVAREADRRIRPVKQSISAGRDDFVLFCGTRGFRDLKRSDAMRQANRDARPREVGSNPIFQDGDLIWDGVVIREIPEMPVIAGVGSGPSDVAPAFLCGAQAIAVAWGQRPKSVLSKEDDYGFVHKVGIEECRATAKMVWNGVQHGMVNVFHSAPASV